MVQGHAYTVIPAQQADAVLSQANPVSGTLYTVLDTTRNVRIISIGAKITWATTQPTPLEVVVTIDGVTLTFSVANPVSATPYIPCWYPDAETDMVINAAVFQGRSFFVEGRSVKVQVRVTWATTQPTPLSCRVKYAQY